MTVRTSDWTKYTLQSFIENPDVVVGMFLDFLCLCHPPAIVHLVQMVLNVGTIPDPWAAEGEPCRHSFSHAV